MQSLFSAGLLATLLASTAYGRPLLNDRQSTSSIPTDGDFTFQCNQAGSGWTIFLPGDGSATQNGYDVAGNCGGGVLDNLHGEAAIIDNWGCTYVGNTTAEMQFSCTLCSADVIVSALESATGATIPASKCNGNPITEPVSFSEKRAVIDKRGTIPTDGNLTFSCSWVGGLVDDGYTIYLPGDGSATTTGFDVAGNCGGGVLDNMHGQGLSPTSWGCNYIGTSTAVMTFNVELGADSQVAAAINAATGSQQATCTTGPPPTQDVGDPPDPEDGTDEPSDPPLEGDPDPDPEPVIE